MNELKRAFRDEKHVNDFQCLVSVLEIFDE